MLVYAHSPLSCSAVIEELFEQLLHCESVIWAGILVKNPSRAEINDRRDHYSRNSHDGGVLIQYDDKVADVRAHISKHSSIKMHLVVAHKYHPVETKTH